MKIAAIREEDIEGYHAAFDSVAREKVYLGRLRAAPMEDVRKYVTEGLRRRRPQFLAWVDGKVAGWCDVTEKLPDLMQHSGNLGMGIVADHRGRGIGAALMEATLADAKAKGFKRIDLTVRTDNARAKRLYERFGFEVEGVCRRHLLLDGKYYESFLMSVLYD